MSAQADLLRAVMTDAHKAWTATPMMARVGRERARQVCDALATDGCEDLVALMVDIVGPAHAVSELQSGGAESKSEGAGRLGRYALSMLMRPSLDQRDRMAAVNAGGSARLAAGFADHLQASMLAWVDQGAGMVDASADLKAVDELIGSRPEVRLSLVAPYAPAVVHCAIVARAVLEGYPFTH